MSWIQRHADAITVGVLFFLLLHLLVVFPRLINHDVGVFLELGYRLIDGERLYVDYEENDFPAIHYISAVPTAIAKALDISPYLPFVSLIWLGSLASILYSGHQARRLGVPQAAAFIQIAMTIYTVLFYLDFTWGQREHIFLILYMPWLIMRLIRYQGGKVVPITALLIGLGAGLGVSIKPYFTVIAVLPELYLLLSTRQFRQIIRWEILGVALVAIAHVLYFALQPEVWAAFQQMTQRLLAGYGAFGSPSLVELLILCLLYAGRAWGVLFVLTPFLGWLFFRRWRTNLSTTTFAFAYAALGAMLALFLQGKGWGYHSLPFTGLSSVLMAWMLPFILTSLRVAISYPLRIGIVVIVLFIAGRQYIDAISKIVKIDQFSYSLSGIIENYSKVGDWVMFVDDGLAPAYPMLITMRRHNASRYAMTVIPVAYYQYKEPPHTEINPIVPAYAQEYLDNFVKDLELHQPPLIFIRSDRVWSMSENITDYHQYLIARGVMDTAVLPYYDLLIVQDNFHIYLRR